MLKKATFTSDADLNAFFRQNSNSDGESTIYLVKLIILNNPITRAQEQHLVYSEKSMMKAGQHMRIGVAMNGKV